MTRVLHITTVDSTIQILLMPLLKSLQSRGYTVEVACFTQDWQESIEREGIKTHPISAFNRKMDPLSDIKAIFQIISLLRHEKFDIVHTHTPKPNLYGRVASRLMGVPVVIGMEHGFYFYNMSGLLRKLYKCVSWVGALFSNSTIVINDDDFNLALREKIIAPKKTVPLLSGLGVDINRFDKSADGNIIRVEFGFPDDAVIVAYVGRLTQEKGCLDLIYAAEKVVRTIPESYFLFVGPSESDIGKVLKHLVELKNMTRNVLFTGPRSDIPEIFAAIDILVLPSYREGLGMVLLEAAAAGIPAVATNVRGCKDVIINGITGYLVPPKDINSLADAIIALASDKDMRRKMGDAARVRAIERFDATKVYQEIDALYQRLLAEKKVLSSVS